MPVAPPGQWRHGFTLVEVLVALLIMGVIAAMGWQGVSAMSTARERNAQASERTLRLQTVIGQWEHDLQAVYDSPRAPGLQFDGASLRLVRRNDDAVQVVVWSLREGVWRRWASPAIRTQGELEQTWMTSQQLLGNDAGQLALLQGVTDWQLFFFRGQSWSNAQSSGDTVPAIASQPAAPASGASAPSLAQAQRVALPTGARLQIDLPEGRLIRDVILSPQP
jgi:general secretion pathway protein J